MKKNSILVLLFLCLLIPCNKLISQNKVTYSFDKKIPVPGDGGYDYLSIDSVMNRLYISHGTSVNVLDLKTETLIGEIKDMKGVHGIAIDNELNRGFISDGKANAVVAFDLKTFEKIATIPVSGIGPDAIMYDPSSKKVYSFNGESKDASVVDAKSLKQVGTIKLGGGPEFAVSDLKGKIFNNIEDLNQLKVLDSHSLKVIDSFPLSPCGTPTGLALDLKYGRIFTGCRKNKGLSVLDMVSGKVLTTVPIGGGVDAVVYNPNNQLIFCSCGDGTTSIIQQGPNDSYTLLQTLTTEPRAKTMAMDFKTGKIYLSAPSFETGTRKIVPGSFHLLVYKPN